jgi:hypothetical protein
MAAGRGNRGESAAIKIAERDAKLLFVELTRRFGTRVATRIFRSAVLPSVRVQKTFPVGFRADSVLLKWQQEMKALDPNMTDRQFAQFMYDLKQGKRNISWGKRHYGTVDAIVDRLRQLTSSSS